MYYLSLKMISVWLREIVRVWPVGFGSVWFGLGLSLTFYYSQMSALYDLIYAPFNVCLTICLLSLKACMPCAGFFQSFVAVAVAVEAVVDVVVLTAPI